MALVVTHRRHPDALRLLLGAGHGKWAHGHARRKLSFMPNVAEEGERGVAFVCDSAGAIAMMSLEHLVVRSVDGVPPARAVERGSRSAVVLDAGGRSTLFLGAALASWDSATSRGTSAKLAELRDGDARWRDADRAIVRSLGGASPRRALEPGEHGVSSRVVLRTRGGARHAVLDLGLGVSERAPDRALLRPKPTRQVHQGAFVCGTDGRARWVPLDGAVIESVGGRPLQDALERDDACGLTRLTDPQGGGHCFLLGTVYAESAWASAGPEIFGDRHVWSDASSVVAVGVCNERGQVRFFPADALRVTRIDGGTPTRALTEAKTSAYR
ncbi:MAG: hypothetical protein EVA89_27920 [Sandaracinaceae bacterium]|nr:MAG: hypothetical protein EVA89_27920 [Sandaracinaceae bacterium]